MRQGLLAVSLALSLLAPARGDDLGLKVPPGFKVTLWADHEMANDIYAMTLDSEGNPVVTSRGWIKRLVDTAKKGKADKVTLLAETKTGGMGLCWSDIWLYFCGDGWLSEYNTLFPEKVAKEPDRKIVPLLFTEHGGHAVRKGPDGRWYVVYGNVSAIEKINLDAASPIKKPEAGGILRLSRDFKRIECIAQGFRNPYDFDFTPLGDIITYDSDTERDFLLPWYSPTRMYHVAHGMHHGWRLPGHLQSLARRDYYPDVVDILWPVGRGSPTGVVCYRHLQFPRHYHGGVFALDWTFGKIFFFPLDAEGSTYRTKGEIFLEPAGGNGFAPTDACVAPDGSLFVSIGGRGTRGAIYRIEYVGTKDEALGKYVEPDKRLDRVLTAPQPLDAWSRAKWERTVSSHLNRDQMADAAADERRPVPQRMRAIEILNDRFDGLPIKTAKLLAQANEWQVRARTAWSLGRDLPIHGERFILNLTLDEHPKVRVEALNSLGDLLSLPRAARPEQLSDGDLVATIAANLGHADKRVRMAASRLVNQLDTKEWLALEKAVASGDLRTRLTFAISHHAEGASGPLFPTDSIKIALEGLESSDPLLRLAALRLLMLLDGDWCLHKPPEVVYSAYALQNPPKMRRDIEKKIRDRLHRIYPTGDARFDAEAGRYFAMIEDDDPQIAAVILGRISKASPTSDDVHHLIILSRLKGKRTEEQTAAVVDALLGLETKLQGQQLRVKQTWGPRLSEVVAALMAKFPGMAEAVLKHPGFVSPAHVAYAMAFTGEGRKTAARLFLEAARKDADFIWTPELVELLGALSPEECRPAFRKQWSDFSLREAMLKHFVVKPDAADRGLLLDGLDSPDRSMVLACIAALQQLPADKSAANLIMPLRRLRISFQDPKEAAVRGKLLALVNHLGGTEFAVAEKSTDPLSLTAAYEPLFAWFEGKYPAEAKRLRGDEEDGEHWKRQLAAARWEAGNPERGLKLFRERSCLTCHSGTSRIGPDLTGAAGRFSRDDLFTAIVYPSRDVAPAYRVNDIETQDGKNLSGIVIFEAAEGIIVQTGANTTIRIDAGNLASRKPSSKSLMPNGLLKDLKPDDLADLYAYLKSLKSGP